MVIARCDRAFYPPDWDTLALQIKGEVGWHCEHCGKECRKTGEPWEAFCRRVAISRRSKKGAFVLGVAHLDQNPGNNARSNLKALCAPCHLAHDRPYRNHNAYKKRERRGQLNLLEGYYPEPPKPARRVAPPKVFRPSRQAIADHKRDLVAVGSK